MTLAIDTSGVLSANLVSNEAILTSAIYPTNLDDIYPAAGPFWATGLVVTYVDNLAHTTVLTLNIDYSLQYIIPGVLAGNGSAVYGAVRLINQSLNGTIKLTYHALGGSWIYNAADIAAYQAQNYLNPLAQQVVLAPDPMVYAGNNNTVLDSFANITAFQTLFAPVRLGVAYVSLSGPSAGSGAPLPTNAAQESGGNLSAIAGAAATQTTTLASILSTLQSKQDFASTIWFDATVTPPAYYIRREVTAVNGTTIAITWENAAGVTQSPVVANLQAVSNSENIHNSTTTFTATVASNTVGCTYAIGDILIHVFGIDMAIAVPSLAYSFWMNLGPSVANGTVLTSSPAGNTISVITTPITATSLPLPTGAATNAAQVSAQSSFTSILAALQSTLITEDVGLASIVDSTTTANVVYFCEAVAGSLTSAAVWRISKLSTATGVTTWANGTSAFSNTPYSGGVANYQNLSYS